MGETNQTNLVNPNDVISLDTYGGKIDVEWDPSAAVTPLGQLPFFINFLKISGIYDKFIEECPLKYTSNNAPKIQDIIGTLLLSILAGHNKYAHINAIRSDGVNPELLGMNKVVSEDAARNALRNNMEEEEGIEWLEKQLSCSTEAALSIASWIMDIDTTVKCIYGNQEGAEKGYNPKKPGRPSHSYHGFFMANTRLTLNVEVQPGNHFTSKHVAPGLWELLDKLPDDKKPAFIRADSGYSNEPILAEAEKRNIDYLSKMRLTPNVKRLIEKLFNSEDWVDAGHGFSGTESTLRLQGWSKNRRVIVLRRVVGNKKVVVDNQKQLGFIFVETDNPAGHPIEYEYAVLVTSLKDEIRTIAQHYRDRSDMENCFDELKNQWGWGGFTTKDMKRCRIISRMVALIYNWWSLFVRLANPKKHHEAVTSRPLLLHGIAKQTKHGGQTFLTITNLHAKTEKIQYAIREVTAFLDWLKMVGKKLTISERMKIIFSHAYRFILNNIKLCPHNCSPNFTFPLLEST